MKTHAVVLSAVILGLAASGARAQHAGHGTPAQPGANAPSTELVAACIEANRQVAALADRTNDRLESARQTNDPQVMRAAFADLQAALVEIRAHAANCAPLEGSVASGDPHLGHTTPDTSSPAAADPHAGHAMPESSNTETIDPVCAMKVDPATAPRATHEGKTYYFCSEADRQKFLENPSAFSKEEPVSR
jgi:YHS domain-containing protein